MTQLMTFYDAEPLRNERVPELTQNPMSEIDRWEFPLGAAATRVVYIRPPIERQVLVPFSSYGDWLLKDRYNEALRIVNLLGASEVLCGSFRQDGRKVKAEIQVKGIGPNFEYVASRMTDVRYRHLGRGSEPRDPAPLRWPEEPGFEAARVAVLQNRAHEVTLVISNQTDFSVRGDLGDRLKRLGLNLGAGTERSESSTLHLVAKFPDFGNGRRR